MKKAIFLIFCAGIFAAPAFAQQKTISVSPACDNVHLEKVLRSSPAKFVKYALIENAQQPSVYYQNFSPGVLSLNKPPMFPQPKQYNFEKRLFKISNYSSFGLLAKQSISN